MKTGFLKILFVAFIASMLSALPAVAENEQTTKVVTKGVADSVALQRASIYFADEVLLHDMDLSITSIDSTAVPELDYGMFNVSVEGEGFRFLPHGTHFGGDGATVKLGYDRTRIPSGYTEDDIRTYYYDTDKKNWVALQLVEVDKQQACVISRTTHFTDMINGVIVAPESPETSAFTPTMMNDIKAADPTSKINIITPPTANNRGSANLQYPFEMPPARNGMQPQVALSYNSDGGSGWAGEGWDISIPSITVDTRWGVPRYNTTYETETYLLNGQMLAMMNGNEMTVAHRTDSVLRQENRQFFMRQGGDFNLIIREGDSIDNYYWVVTDRNGVKYTYGGDANARLSGTYIGVDGIPRTVVAEWKLTRIEEPHGDYIEYIYNNIEEDTISSNLRTKAIYLSQINVGNAGSLPHTKVTFKNLDAKKTIKINNARYGFLTSSSQLLDSVLVEFKESGNYEKLRSYKLEYADGSFYKKLLSRVSHRDNFGNEVSYQEFDYYNDIFDGSNIVPYQSISDTLNLSNDDLNAGFINPLNNIGNFSDNATAIGGTKSKNTGFSLYAGVGPNDNNLSSKSNTGGISFSYSYSSSSGVSTWVDIDGDGIPDKVFVEDGTLKYRSTLMANSVVSINGIKDFLKTSSHTIGAGYKLHPSIHGVTFVTGKDYSYSKSKTDTYFADVNGDGLIDIVNNGKVYFNCTEYVNGVLNTHFSLSSADSPSPINNIGTIDTSATEATEEEIEDAVANSPMVDMVRVWVAPYDGNIQISGTVELLPPQEEDEDGADGIWYSIQHNDVEVVSDSIRYDNSSPPSAFVPQRQVIKGDKIFFRLQSGRQRLSDGSSDRVNWNPIVKYLGKPNYTTPNGHLLYTFDSKESEVVSSTNLVPYNGTNNLEIRSYFKKPLTSDNVTLRIFTSSERVDTAGNAINYTRHKVYERNFGWNEEYCDSLSFPITHHANENYIECEVKSSSNVPWEKVKWKPLLFSESDSISLPVKYSVYADNIKEGAPFYAVFNDTLTIDLQGYIYNPSQANGDMIMTVKSPNKLLAKQTLHFSNGSITDELPITIYTDTADSIWVELFTENRELAESFLGSPASQILPPREPSHPFTEIDEPGPYASIYSERYHNTTHVLVNLFTVADEERFGPLYRGWGQFAYNTGTDNRYATPIDTSLLKLYDSNISINDTLDVRTITFSLVNPDNETQNRWYGPNHDVFITGTTMGASRLGIKDVALSNPLANVGNVDTYTSTKWIGTSARGIPLLSTSDSRDNLFETSVEIGVFGASVSRNEANGTSQNKTSFFDLNGDGYPDIVSGDMIQYTNTHGGFSGEKYNGIGGESGINNAIQYGVGGNALHSFSLGNHEGNANPGAEKNGKSAQNAKNMTIGFNAGVGIGSNDDYSNEAFIDINGDGLPDKVKDDGTARINLGYSFTNPIPWGVDTVQKTHSFRIDPEAGLSLPFSIDKNASSFSAGIGISTMGSQGEYSMFDVNGDGLPDAINKSNNHINVALNLGSSFATPILWQNTSEINKSTSTSESANAAFTIGVPIVTSGLKLAINTGAYYGHSMNRPRFEFKDIDGDGFIDILESDSENKLSVKHSTIARTNKLRTVTNSLGGTFTIDYKHNTPTYGLPGGKWVMSSLDIDYGIHGAYEIPNTKNVFEYNNGRRDRHEREFLGFGQVITKNIDTEHNMSVYRQTVEEYDTCSIYTAGNLLRTYVAKPTGVKLTEVENGYYSYGLTNSTASGVNGGKYKFNENFQLWNDRGSAYSPLKYTKNLQYEGSSNGTVMSESWNSYYTHDGEHGLLKDYRYSDKGTLGNDGAGNYDYNTAIDYSNKLTGTNYYFGHPKKVTVSKGSKLYHLVEATYNNTFPTHLTSIKRAVNVKMVNQEPDGPSGPVGPTGGGSVTNPNTLPSTFYTPDTHADIQSYGDLDYAQTNFEYDEFGNLTRVILPEGSDSTRVYYEYIYEDTLSTYVREVDDIFGLNSIDMSHDFRYGITNLTIDQNGARYLVTNDNVGRMSAVRSPNELDADNMTMLFEYNPIAIVDNGVIIKPASATTTYYFRRKYRNNINEETDVKSMKITTFVDGFGRVIETRKESNIRTE